MSLIESSRDLESSVNRLFDYFIKDLNIARRGGTRSGHINSWSPVTDAHETDKEIIVNTELSGLSKDQINVDVRDSTLAISGETKQDEKYKEGNTHIQEHRYGSFNRSISLPPNVKPDDITAKFENGLLELKLPRTAPFSKKIEIQ